MPASVLWHGGAGYSVSSPVPAAVQQAVLTIPPTTPEVVGEPVSIAAFIGSQPYAFDTSFNGIQPYEWSFVTTSGRTIPVDDYNASTFTDPAIAEGGTLYVTFNLGLSSHGLTDTGVIVALVCDCQVRIPGYTPWFVSLGQQISPGGLPVTHTQWSTTADLAPWLAFQVIFMLGTFAPTFSFPTDPTVPFTQEVSSANGVTYGVAAYIATHTDSFQPAWPLLPTRNHTMDARWDWVGSTNNFVIGYYWAGPRLLLVPVRRGARGYAQVVG